MSFTHKVFDFDGRIGRLTYLLYTILNGLLTAVLIVGGLVLARPGLLFIPGLLLMIAAVFCLVWVNLALTVKRLHDTGRSGAHAMWIALLGGVAMISPFGKAALALVIAAALVGVFCWLAYAPGETGRNMFGPAPDGGLTRDSAGN